MADNGNRDITFKSTDGVARYVGSRYTSPRQRWVDQNEQECLATLLQCHIPRQTRQAVLDVPCGYGRILPLLTGLGFTYHWCDISESMADYVRQRKDCSGLGSGSVASIEAMHFDNGQFDLTTTVRLFHHFHDSEQRIQVLKELARVSRHWVLVSFYDRFSLHRWTKRFFTFIQGRRQRIAFISRKRFAREASLAGLKIVEMKAWKRFLHAHTFALLTTNH